MDVESAESFAETLAFQGNRNAADARLRVTFEEVEVEDLNASREAGVPKFKTRHIGTIHIPGDKDNVVSFDAERMDDDQRRRFGPQYQEWKKTHENRVEGTLLRECGGVMSRSRAREWEALHVLTVEQLAELTDANLQNMRGGVAERQKARDFLAAAKGQAPLAQARAESAKLRAEVETLREQVQKLTELLEQRTEPAQGKKGR